MEIFNWNDLNSFRQSYFFSCGTAISIGSFDGLHLGHRFLIEALVKGADERNLCKGLITFSRPLPAIKHSGDYSGDISTLKQRLALFEQLGIDFVFVVDFSDDFASLKGAQFLSLLSDKCNMKFLAEGIDFRCGYKGATDTQAIKYWATQNDVECAFVDPVYYTDAEGNEERVSSSYIRQMIQKGFFTRATELLARPYELDIATIRQSGECLQVLPPAGLYHPHSESSAPVPLEIQNNKITSLPECESVRFI